MLNKLALLLLCAKIFALAETPTKPTVPHIAYGGGWNTALYFIASDSLDNDVISCIVVDHNNSRTGIEFRLTMLPRSVQRREITGPPDGPIRIGMLRCEYQTAIGIQAVYDYTAPDGQGFQAGTDTLYWHHNVAGREWVYDGKNYKHGLACGFYPSGDTGNPYGGTLNKNSIVVKLFQDNIPVTQEVELNPQNLNYMAVTLEDFFPQFKGKVGRLKVVSSYFPHLYHAPL